MEYISNTLGNLVDQTAFMNLTFGNLIMIAVACVFLYLAFLQHLLIRALRDRQPLHRLSTFLFHTDIPPFRSLQVHGAADIPFLSSVHSPADRSFPENRSSYRKR